MLWKDNEVGKFRVMVREKLECLIIKFKQDNYGSENRRGLLGKERVEEDWRF